MDNYGNNGHTSELAQFETPFADIQSEIIESFEPDMSQNYVNNYQQEVESPFLKTFETSSARTGASVAGDDYVELLSELNDQDFTNTLYELAADAENSWTSKFAGETSFGANHIPLAIRHAKDYFEPLAQEAESMIDKVTEHFSKNNMGDFSEGEINSFFNELHFDHYSFSPPQEQFLGGVFNKVKSVVQKGVDLAKKGVSVVGKILPMNIILGKIKGLIRPLLDKVLKYAIGKIPKKLQPYAQTLAKKFLNLETTEYETIDQYSGEDELDAIQTELDGHLAQMVFSPNDHEADAVVSQYETSFNEIERTNSYETSTYNVPSLNEAREKFINDLKELRPGESPTPAIENFLPAAIVALRPAIKMAISIIGRKKVINFLAGLLSKLVAQYVPANVAQPLAASIVDVGMSAIGFETAEMQKPDLAYEAIANTIEDTVRNLSELNEANINDEESMTMHLLEAFESAAANNFPSQYIREDLRPAKQPALWVVKPRHRQAHSYKKYTNVFNITIDPQTASAVTSFRGLPLTNFLKDKLGLDPTKPISAKVHLFEATSNTRLSRIPKYEKLPGLNPAQPYAWVQLHPLTPKASSMLLKEPALGKDIPAQYLHGRHRTYPGERFYYLEISGAKLRIPHVDHSKHKHAEGGKPDSSRPNQSGDIQAVINFIKSEILINYYFSEEDSKTIVEKLNQSDFLGAAQGLRSAIKSVFNEMLLKNISTKVKIVHESFPELYLEKYEEIQEHFSVSDAIGGIAGKGLITKIVEKLVERISDDAYQAVANYLKAKTTEFKEAQAQPQDGVTVKIIWKNIQGMSAIRSVINAVRGNLSLNNLSGLSIPKLTTPVIQVVADKKFN